MNSPAEIAVINRFFIALRSLKDLKMIKTYNKFYEKYGFHRGSLMNAKNHPEVISVRMDHLIALTDYGISADWLLTGRGEMLQKKNLNDYLFSYTQKPSVVPNSYSDLLPGFEVPKTN